MFSRKPSTLVCPECGQRNRAEARFCEACAARLGAEPSIASRRAPTRAPLPPVATPGALATSAAGGGDSRFDAPRTVHSRPLPLQAQAASSSGFWIKFCIGGLILMIGFIAWSLYMLTGSKAPAQLPSGQAGGAGTPTAIVAPTPSLSATPTATPTVTPPAAGPASTGAAAALSLPARPATSTPTSNVPPATDRFPAAESSAARPTPARQTASRQRARPAPSEVQPADFGGWVEPSRPPAMTSSPNYQDAGPPVVAGPSPSVAPAQSQSPAPSATPTEPFVRMRPAPSSAVNGAPDLGPPVAAGPGPHYDYSTPNAAGR